jgi:peptidoglycan/xylan/chitin deacetylase (PgdA/CDA1 family)
MVARNWRFMSHGIYNTRPVWGMAEDEERRFLQDTIDSLKRHTGQELKGMLGPTISATPNTPDLMAEAGLTYHADWPHDDQPVPLRVRRGRLVSMPYSFGLNDANPAPSPIEDIAQHWIWQFDRLWSEGAASGRVMCIPVHPYVIGQPYAIRQLRRVLEHIASHDGVWYTTADEIADHYLVHHHDEHLEHAQALVRRTSPGSS